MTSISPRTGLSVASVRVAIAVAIVIFITNFRVEGIVVYSLSVREV